jgi:hypothetical protein
MLWWCIKILSREYPRRPSPLAELLQGSSQVVDVVADLLQFGPELRLQALALGRAESSGAAPLFLQPEALVLQLSDPVADLSTPAHVLASTLLSPQRRALRGWRMTVQLLPDLVGALIQFQRLLAHLR